MVMRLRMVWRLFRRAWVLWGVFGGIMVGCVGVKLVMVDCMLLLLWLTFLDDKDDGKRKR